MNLICALLTTIILKLDASFYNDFSMKTVQNKKTIKDIPGKINMFQAKKIFTAYKSRATFHNLQLAHRESISKAGFFFFFIRKVVNDKSVFVSFYVNPV